MRRIRTILLATAAVAAMAFAGAATASAAPVWEGVTVNPTGTLTADATASTLHTPGLGDITCTVNLGNITVDANGATTISDVTITTGMSGSPLCPLVVPNDPWSDQICQIKDDNGNEWFWDRIDIDLTVAGIPVTGPLDVLLTEGSAHGPGPLTPDGAVVDDSIGTSGFGVTATYTLHNDSGITGVSDPEKSCPWTPKDGKDYMPA